MGHAHVEQQHVGLRRGQYGDGDATVEVLGEDGAVRPIGVVDGHPFEDNSMGIYKVAVLRFADLPQQGSVVTRATPLAIGTAYE